MAKTMQHIEFPEILDMSAHSAYGCNGESDTGHASWAGNSEMAKISINANKRNRVPIPYRLMSIIEHRGNAHAGHYQTYRRVLSPGGKGKEWAFVSDENVSFVEWGDVRKCQAYMLFYEAA
jgi:ubiquitin C-terminal hydrolase